MEQLESAAPPSTNMVSTEAIVAKMVSSYRKQLQLFNRYSLGTPGKAQK